MKILVGEEYMYFLFPERQDKPLKIILEGDKDMISRFDGIYSFLSNHYASPIEWEGLLYPTVEHAYQASKSETQMERRLFSEENLTPGKAKRYGRYIKLRSDWEEVKESIMYELCKKKFVIPCLREKLLSTGKEYLIEGNTWGDQFWGMTFNDDGELVGQNHLGKILMKIREEIKNESSD